MDPLVYLGIGVVVGMVVGGVIGWLVGARRAAGGAGGVRIEAELRDQIRQREAELAQVRTQLDRANDERAAAQALRVAAESAQSELRQKLVERETALESMGRELAGMAQGRGTAEARLAASEQLLASQKSLHERALADARQAQDKALADLREAFRALSAEALRRTQPEFLQLATETLGRFQETARGDLAQRQTAIGALLKPLEEQLKTYQERLAQSETAQSTALGEVRKQLDTLSQQSQTLALETQQFRQVLHSSQARGHWGEETLRRVVEAAGLSAHCDFSEQTLAGDAKPDLLVHLPANRVIIVDAKVPDLEFLGGADLADAGRRAEVLAAHAAKLKATIRALADRDYPRQFPNALDHVVLFLPAESLFSAALEGDRDLIVWAASRRILLATPASLIALLRSVSVSWQQHAQSENARAIAAAAQELYARVAKFAEHFEKIRSGLDKANRAFGEAVASYQSRIRPAGERLAQLGGGAAGKEFADVRPLETAAVESSNSDAP